MHEKLGEESHFKCVRKRYVKLYLYIVYMYLYSTCIYIVWSDRLLGNQRWTYWCWRKVNLDGICRHTHINIYMKKYWEIIKIAIRMVVLERKCVSEFRSCEGIRFKGYSRRTPAGIWGLDSSPRNSPDFLTLERSRGMWLHLTRFGDALFSFALQTLTCSCLPPK